MKRKSAARFGLLFVVMVMVLAASALVASAQEPGDGDDDQEGTIETGDDDVDLGGEAAAPDYGAAEGAIFPEAFGADAEDEDVRNLFLQANELGGLTGQQAGEQICAMFPVTHGQIVVDLSTIPACEPFAENLRVSCLNEQGQLVDENISDLRFFESQATDDEFDAVEQGEDVDAVPEGLSRAPGAIGFESVQEGHCVLLGYQTPITEPVGEDAAGVEDLSTEDSTTDDTTSP